MYFGAPQLIMLAIHFLFMGIHIAKHGERKTDFYNAWEATISTVIFFVLLYWGGFFDQP